MKMDTNNLLFSLSRALDYIEQEALGTTANHSKRVSYICMCICTDLGLNCVQIYDMAACAILHDNALTEFTLAHGYRKKYSMEILRNHCTSGEINAIGFPFLGDVKNIILHHHENWDGTGCFKLKQDEICLRSAVLRFADGLDLIFALGKDTKNKLPDIINHINKYSGILYSPIVTKSFFNILNDNFIKHLKDENISISLNSCSPYIEQDIHYERLAEIGNIFASIIDAKSKFTLRHSKGIALKSSIMADYYNFDEMKCAKFILAANLHDIGKLIIPNSILDKTGQLNSDEFTIMKTHVEETDTILSSIKGFEDICAWACGHHEKLDGSGYHQKLNRDNMPFETRLLSCIDIFQALTEDRPYREAMNLSKAFNILEDLVRSGKIDSTIVGDLKTVFTNDELLKKHIKPYMKAEGFYNVT